MTRLPEYEIEQDCEGFYIMSNGWDLCRTYRFGTLKQAQLELEKWMREDSEAQGENEL